MEKIDPNISLDDYLAQNKINAKNWTAARRIIADQQLKYLKAGIDAGVVDGLEGPQTAYAREIWFEKNAQKVSGSVSVKGSDGKPQQTLAETWRDNEYHVNPVKDEQFGPWPTQGNVTKFFGQVGTNQVQAKLPYEMVIAWNPSQKVTSFTCHKLVKEPMEFIFAKTLEAYGYERIVQLRLHYFGGCLNVRKMRGGSAYSMHSWGIAVDLDPERNQLRWGKDKAQFARPEYYKFWDIVESTGAISLGRARNFDWMHLQFARL